MLAIIPLVTSALVLTTFNNISPLRPQIITTSWVLTNDTSFSSWSCHIIHQECIKGSYYNNLSYIGTLPIFEGENETIGDDWLRVLVSPWTVPGASGLHLPHGGFYNKSITLKPGETEKTYYTLHTGEGGPGEVSYNIYRITGKVNRLPMPEEEKLPMPEGLTVSIEPNHFLARTHEDYTSKITVKTSPELLPGEYILCMEERFVGLTNHWLTVNVEP